MTDQPTAHPPGYAESRVADNPAYPTRDERIARLSRAVTTINDALNTVAGAMTAVVPSSPRNVLSREANFDYQRALADGRHGLVAARDVAQQALDDLVPPRCAWPGGHLGPISRVEPFESVQRCAACGEEWGK